MCRWVLKNIHNHVTTTTVKIWNISTTLKCSVMFLWSQFHLLPLLYATRQPLICLLSIQISLDFSRISYKWNHNSGILLCLAYLLNKLFWGLTHVVAVVHSWVEFCPVIPCSLLNSVTFYEYTIICLFIHWVVSNFWLLWIKLLWTSCVNLWVYIHFHFSWIKT